MAELAPFDFDILYITGPKNVVADTLSREPFARPTSIMQRLTRTPYTDLPKEAESLQVNSVQAMSACQDIACPLSFLKLGNSKQLLCLTGFVLGPQMSTRVIQEAESHMKKSRQSCKPLGTGAKV